MKPLGARFWEKVNTSASCWEWSGGVHEFGYGVLNIASPSKYVRAHRFSWELFLGRIPENRCVLHRCDNPGCVRPSHLFLGSKSDNSIDMARKARVRNAKLTESAVKEIKGLLRSGGLTHSEIARAFSVSKAAIQKIGCGQNWRWV